MTELNSLLHVRLDRMLVEHVQSTLRQPSWIYLTVEDYSELMEYFHQNITNPDLLCGTMTDERMHYRGYPIQISKTTKVV